MGHNPVSSFNLYHGTIQKHLTEILKSKEFTFKPRIDHWLGNGVYFFVNDVDKALWWSEMATRRFHEGIENRGILFIGNYKIERNKLFDLDTEVDKKRFTDFLKHTKNAFNMKLTSKDPDKRKIEARVALINIMVEYYEMSAVKYTFHKENLGNQKFLSGLNLNNNETQFCITNTETIDFNNVYDITQEVI